MGYNYIVVIMMYVMVGLDINIQLFKYIKKLLLISFL